MSTKLRESLSLLAAPSERPLVDVEDARARIKALLDPAYPEYESEKVDLKALIKEIQDASSFVHLEGTIRSLIEVGICHDAISEIAGGWRISGDINLSVLAGKAERWLKSSQAKFEEDKEVQPTDLLGLTNIEKETLSVICELRFADETSKRYRAFRLFPEPFVKDKPRHIAVLSSKEETTSPYGQKLKAQGFNLLTSYLEANKAIDERKYYNFVVVDLAQPRSEEIERSEIEAARKFVDKLFDTSDKLEYIQFSLNKLPAYEEIKYNDQWYYYSIQKVDSNPYVVAKIKEDLYSLRLEDELLPGEHREILWLFADPTAKKIIYRQIKSGFSGTSNYLVYTIDDYDQRGEPTIIKITTAKKAFDEEMKYQHIIKDWIPTSPLVTKKIYKNEEMGAVCYQYAHRHPGIQSRTLKDLYLSGDKEISEICGLIEELFVKKLMRFNNTRGWLSRTVKKEFGDYIKDDKIRESFEAILPGNVSDQSVTLYGETFPNPIAFWDSMKLRDENYPTKRVHGDLHTENIMIDDDNQVFLIDYAKAMDQAHLFIDYAMLEVSVKLDLLHRSTPYSEIISFEKYLCSWSSLDDQTSYSCPYKGLMDCLTITKCIRSLTKPLIEKMGKTAHSFDPMYHYYLALFCLTFAQLAFKDMNQQYGLISSGLLAKRLRQMQSIGGDT